MPDAPNEKAGPQAGFVQQEPITSMQRVQQLPVPKKPVPVPKQPEQQRRAWWCRLPVRWLRNRLQLRRWCRMRRWSMRRLPVRQQRQTQPVRRRQVLPEQQLRELRLPEQQLLPSWRKQPAQQPAGKRSGDFFSCTFLLIDQYCLR